MITFSVKNFEKFQHYKDRAPPWIKLYNELLENYEFGVLPDALKGQLIGIWLLASRTENKLPMDPVWISSKINATCPVDLDALLEAGFIICGAQAAAAHVEQSATQAQRVAKSNGFGSRHISDDVKRAVWQRDNGHCCECGSDENIEYDHKHPISKGGNSEESNIQLLCRTCNRRKRTRLATPGLSSRSLETETETETEKEADSRSVAIATQPRAPDRFEEFWKAYPRRDGPNPRSPAEKKFRALVKSGVDPTMMIAAASSLASSESAKGNIGTRFIPQAMTWLNQQRWADHAAVAFLAFDISPEDQIDAAVKQFAKLGFWSRWAGPNPGMVGCRASPELLAKHGLAPDGRKLESAVCE